MGPSTAASGSFRVGSTPRDVVHREGTARLYRFRGGDSPAGGGMPLLLVPSLINRWYVLDLRPGGSLVEALVRAGFDTHVLDWGVPEAEDRYLTWERVLSRLARALRVVKRRSGRRNVGLLGYCMGGTLCGIHTALHPEDVGALVNLAGPFDFSEGGVLAAMTDARWFDPALMAEAGNIGPDQMQSGFLAMRPTQKLSKWVSLFDPPKDATEREAKERLEDWAADNVPFPGAAYATYVKELYQENNLVKGLHHVGGKRVDLARIQCPVLTVLAERDAICPPKSALAINEKVGSKDVTSIAAPGGHVGAVVGTRAQTVLYPAIAGWFSAKLAGNTGLAVA